MKKGFAFAITLIMIISAISLTGCSKEEKDLGKLELQSKGYHVWTTSYGEIYISYAGIAENKNKQMPRNGNLYMTAYDADGNIIDEDSYCINAQKGKKGAGGNEFEISQVPATVEISFEDTYDGSFLEGLKLSDLEFGEKSIKNNYENGNNVFSIPVTINSDKKDDYLTMQFIFFEDGNPVYAGWWGLDEKIKPHKTYNCKFEVPNDLDYSNYEVYVVD